MEKNQGLGGQGVSLLSSLSYTAGYLPFLQCIDGVKDVLGGEVIDDVPVKVPDLQETGLCTPLVYGGHQVAVDVGREGGEIVLIRTLLHLSLAYHQ